MVAIRPYSDTDDHIALTPRIAPTRPRLTRDGASRHRSLNLWLGLGRGQGRGLGMGRLAIFIVYREQRAARNAAANP